MWNERSSWSNSKVQLRFTDPWLPPVERKKRSLCARMEAASFRTSRTGLWAASVAAEASSKGPSLKGWKYPSHDSAVVNFLARALAASGRKAIIVAPQGARDNDTDPEYLDWGPGRNWETAITRDVVGYVDQHWRTIRSRSGRAIVGLSAGGYGAVILALHHLAAFSVVESWSGYFQPTNPAGTRVLDLGSAHANAQASAHAFVASLRRSFARRPTFFAFYVGHADGRFRAENLLFNRELTAAHIPHLFRVYSGGHAQSVWVAHAKAWLAVAVD